MPKKSLEEAVDAVVEDAVSFVGVDLNTCSEALLRRVAGIGDKKAKAVIEYRNENGNFINRFHLKNVKGIGEKTFQQCAGFLRIHCPAVVDQSDSMSLVPLQEVSDGRNRGKRKARFVGSSDCKRRKKDEVDQVELLDGTNIHPESYEAAKQYVLALFCLVYF